LRLYDKTWRSVYDEDVANKTDSVAGGTKVVIMERYPDSPLVPPKREVSNEG